MNICLGLVAVISISSLSAAAKQPPRSFERAPTRIELREMRVTLLDYHEDRLVKLLNVITEKKGIRIDLDRANLQKLCKKPLDELTIVVPPGSLPLGAAIELVANQVHGTLEEKAGRWSIVPGNPNFGQFLSGPTAEMQKAIGKVAEIEKLIESAPAKDIFDFFSEKYDVRIIAAGGFVEHEARFGDKNCTLPVSKKPLIELVEDVARQLDGTIRIYKGLVLVVPRDRSKS